MDIKIELESIGAKISQDEANNLYSMLDYFDKTIMWDDVECDYVMHDTSERYTGVHIDDIHGSMNQIIDVLIEWVNEYINCDSVEQNQFCEYDIDLLNRIKKEND